eukprot:15447901-Alexandrium_andersonii.AAC.1
MPIDRSTDDKKKHAQWRLHACAKLGDRASVQPTAAKSMKQAATHDSHMHLCVIDFATAPNKQSCERPTGNQQAE